MRKKYPEAERYADSEDVVDIDQAFIEFATSYRAINVSKYIGIGNINSISEILNKYKWRNYYSNFSPYIVATFSFVSLFVITLGGVVGFYIIFLLAILSAFALAVSIQLKRQMPTEKQLMEISPPDKRGPIAALFEFKRMLAVGQVPVYTKSDRDRERVERLKSPNRFRRDHGIIWILRSEFPGFPLKTPFGLYPEGRLVVGRFDADRRSRILRERYGDDYSVVMKAFYNPPSVKDFPVSDIDVLSRVFEEFDLMDNPSKEIFSVYRARLALKARGARYSAGDIAKEMGRTDDASIVEKVLAGTYPPLIKRLTQAAERAPIVS